jgi:protein-tyrosine phosphatase
MTWVDDRFGTWRGGVRLALSYPQNALGIAALTPHDMAEVKRLVFVCRGNISRSAYAEGAAKARGMRCASFGVAAAQAAAADPVAVEIANQIGVDISDHRATEAAHFLPEKGDLLLAMEVRQLAVLGNLDHLRDTPRALLGRFAGTPHLHDPYGLGRPYYHHCFARIDRALDRLEPLCPAVKAS